VALPRKTDLPLWQETGGNSVEEQHPENAWGGSEPSRERVTDLLGS